MLPTTPYSTHDSNMLFLYQNPPTFQANLCLCIVITITIINIIIIIIIIGTRWRSAWGIALQTGRSWDRFPMVSLEFFIDIILPTALWSWGGLSL
jgi:hypothetical protein